MPYFYCGPWRLASGRRGVHTRQTESSTFPDGDSLTQGLHLPLTLDEYCNPSLGSATLERRNKDQVVIRHASRERNERRARSRDETEGIGPETRLLMVHQLWIYRFDKHHVMAFPDAALNERTIRNALTEPPAWMRSHQADDFELRSMFRISEWLLAFIGSLETPAGIAEPTDANTPINLPTSAGSPQSVLGIYEESISAVGNEVDSYFGDTMKEQEQAAHTEKQYFHEIADIRGELSMIRSVVFQQELVWTDLKRRVLSYCAENAPTSLDEILEGCDEKSIVERVLLRLKELQNHKKYRNGFRVTFGTDYVIAQEIFSGLQKLEADAQADWLEDVVVQLERRLDWLKKSSPPDSTVEESFADKVLRYLQTFQRAREQSFTKAKETTTKVSTQLQKLKDRIENADQNAERVQNLIPQYLELKRSATSMKEAHYTAVLGAAVLGLSFVTIVFTPMSFILALLAVPKDSLLVEPVPDGYKRHFVRKWTGKSQYDLLIAVD
jgi:hypothetical protein